MVRPFGVASQEIGASEGEVWGRGRPAYGGETADGDEERDGAESVAHALTLLLVKRSAG